MALHTTSWNRNNALTKTRRQSLGELVNNLVTQRDVDWLRLTRTRDGPNGLR